MKLLFFDSIGRTGLLVFTCVQTETERRYSYSVVVLMNLSYLASNRASCAVDMFHLRPLMLVELSCG